MTDRTSSDLQELHDKLDEAARGIAKLEFNKYEFVRYIYALEECLEERRMKPTESELYTAITMAIRNVSDEIADAIMEELRNRIRL